MPAPLASNKAKIIEQPPDRSLITHQLCRKSRGFASGVSVHNFDDMLEELEERRLWQSLMKYCALWALLLGVVLAGGCKKASSEAQAANATEAQTAADTQAAARGAGPMPMKQHQIVVQEGDTGAALNQLSLELKKYVLRTKTAPRNFEQFVALSKVQPPPPPAGKKYAIQSGKVVLVKS